MVGIVNAGETLLATQRAEGRSGLSGLHAACTHRTAVGRHATASVIHDEL